MAFKKKGSEDLVTSSPDQLFRELPRRKYPDVLPHQQSILQKYAEFAEHETDVALQLPTGSGKTLVGLLIAEWRRRKYKEKTLYLCPTKQLVNQVVEQAESKYGLNVTGFTGKKSDYDAGAVANYKLGHSVAVTTYSSVFNTNPFFVDPDIVIVDDAHAAENYISSLWSLQIDRFESKHKAIHAAISDLLKPSLDGASYSRLAGEWESAADRHWVDKLPTPDFHKIHESFVAVMDAYTTENDLRYPWSMLRANLQACHLYISSNCILLRPIIPPTWTHASFERAIQRIFMSATLGEGGDLERLTGRKNIARVAIPDGWDSQGVGRRFFIFPSLSLDVSGCDSLKLELLKKAPRSLAVVPNTTQLMQFGEKITEKTNLRIFGAEDIEKSKAAFIASNGSVALMANRYDGIDFPGDECRLLLIDGLAKTANCQEQFLVTRIGANVLFNERIQTRVIQAIGRCTRSLEDYSAVVVDGTGLVDFLTDVNRRKLLHPELQSELQFGIDQSIDTTFKDLLENYDTFIQNGSEWEDANRQIVNERSMLVKENLDGLSELEECVIEEIAYVKAIWKSDWIDALEKAEAVLGILKSPNLQGYRAMWEYLAGSAAYFADSDGLGAYEPKAREHFKRAKNAAVSIPWLSRLQHYGGSAQSDDEEASNNALIMKQVEGIELFLSHVGKMHDRELVRKEKKIRDGLSSSNEFENAHKALGVHLGFSVGKVEEDGSPDPWWLLENVCFVFEDHANATVDALSATKARQVATHPNWMRENVPACSSDTVDVVAVLVSPVIKAKKGAMPHLTDVSYWNLDEFKKFSETALSTVRELRATFSYSGDLVWRAQAAALLQSTGIDIVSIYNMLEEHKCASILELDGKEVD